MTRAFGFAGLVIALLGCGPQSFQPHFEAPEARSARLLPAQATHPAPRQDSRAFVGVTTAPTQLFAWDPDRGLLWEQPVEAKSAPLIVGDAVVLQEQDGVVVRNLSDGARRVVVSDNGQLVGADGIGSLLVIAVRYEGVGPRGSISLVDGSSVRWTAPLTMPVGVPALIDRHVLVPWATQRLSALSVSDGTELARWHFNNTVLGHALVTNGHVLVGQLGWTRLDERVLQASPDPFAVFTPFRRPLPVQLPLLRDGYLAVAEPENAQHRLALDWQVVAAPDGTLSTANNMLLWRFYRLLFALSSSADELRWVRTFDHDLVGVAIAPGGSFIADSAGTLRFVGDNGVTIMRRELGRSLQVLAIRPAGWIPAADATTDATEAPTGTLREQLYAAAAFDDDRLGAARAYAVEHLARDNDASVTAQLIVLCEDRRSPPQLVSAACAGLAERETGGPDVLTALRRRASFLDGTTAPPVGPLARAAIKMKLHAAGPLLAAHAEDPNTPADDLVVLFDALAQLKHRPAAGPIERFVRLHHAEPAGAELIPALQAATRALSTLRVHSAREALEQVAEDGLTAPALRESATAALAQLNAPAVSSAAQASEANEAAGDTEAPAEVITDPRPSALTPEMVFKAMTPVRRSLVQCFAGDPAHPLQARLSMVVDGAGKSEGIFVVPTTLQACVEPLIRTIQFPATRAGRQRLTHIIRAAVVAPTSPPRKPSKKPTPATTVPPAAG